MRNFGFIYAENHLSQVILHVVAICTKIPMKDTRHVKNNIKKAPRVHIQSVDAVEQQQYEITTLLQFVC